MNPIRIPLYFPWNPIVDGWSPAVFQTNATSCSAVGRLHQETICLTRCTCGMQSLGASHGDWWGNSHNWRDSINLTGGGFTHLLTVMGCTSECILDVWMYGCMDVWVYGCMDVWMYGCMDVWMYGCMDVCMYACMYVCMYTSYSSSLSILSWVHVWGWFMMIPLGITRTS